MPIAIANTSTGKKLGADELFDAPAASDNCPHIPNVATRQILDEVAAGRGLRGAFTSVEALMKDLNA